MRKLILFLSLFWGAGAVGLWCWNDAQARRVSYRTVRIKRSDLRSTISATGTIEPAEVVDVGAQVVGRIESFGADPLSAGKAIGYGSRVERGTVLAQLDASLYRARLHQARGRVAKAEADIQQAEAKLRQADREFDRARKLKDRGKGIISPEEFDARLATQEAAKAALAVCRSELLVAQADLEEAEANVGYTTIRSPLKGIVLDRRINLGQTVVANLNAPSLFLIAKDLDSLEIWSSVNEADIGSIHEGQDVRFTVSSRPRDTFQGKVSQIRLNASMSQNIVTYTVVVAVDNSAGRLLPYLTARVEFEVRVRRDVLLVPNAALRWQPRVQDVIPEARTTYEQHLRRRGSVGGGSGGPSHSPDEPDGLVWLRQGESVRPVDVRIGLSDGVATEVEAEGLREGTEVVVAASRIDAAPDALSILPHTWSEPSKK
jgi:HlyD family secretion protein